MPKRLEIKDLFRGGSAKLTGLKRQAAARSQVLEQVLQALPAELAGAVTTAGMRGAELTLGAVNAAWATRLRYVTDLLRQRVGRALGIEILRIRIRVQPEPKDRPVPAD